MKHLLIPRPLLLNQLIEFQDTSFIKVITGIRRSGKSKLMELMINHLIDSGISKDQIIFASFESLKFSPMNFSDFYRWLRDQCRPDRKYYIFLDEIQNLENWEKLVSGLRVDLDCDIYLSGSNAKMLSSELSTLLSGRYVEIEVLPLSFEEYLRFAGFTIREYRKPDGSKGFTVLDDQNIPHLPDELFGSYMKYGGFPGLSETSWRPDTVIPILDGIVSTVIQKDILSRPKNINSRQLSDPDLLNRIIVYMADTVGSPLSINSVKNQLISFQKSGGGKGYSVHTVDAYINSLTDAYVFHSIKRFDVRGKAQLKTLGKYYLADPGLRNLLLGDRSGDTGHILENIVFLELKRRGYHLAVGKINNSEIDFIASKGTFKAYIQVAQSVQDSSVLNRELAPLIAVPDNYPKILITADRNLPEHADGIAIINLFDWLLETSGQSEKPDRSI